MGDMNADISDEKSLFGQHLIRFCQDSKHYKQANIIDNHEQSRKLDWMRLTGDNLRHYWSLTDHSLSNNDIPIDAIKCGTINCENSRKTHVNFGRKSKLLTTVRCLYHLASLV